MAFHVTRFSLHNTIINLILAKSSTFSSCLLCKLINKYIYYESALQSTKWKRQKEEEEKEERQEHCARGGREKIVLDILRWKRMRQGKLRH